MSKDKEDNGYDWSFSNKSVQERLDAGRKQMEDVREDVGKSKDPVGTIKKKKGNPYGADKPVSGKLDTQLFPNRKPPYHE